MGGLCAEKLHFFFLFVDFFCCIDSQRLEKGFRVMRGRISFEEVEKGTLRSLCSKDRPREISCKFYCRTVWKCDQKQASEQNWI